MDTKHYNLKIDNLKGLLISLVVIGHIISELYDPITYSDNMIFKICYSVHMPMFFVISGYLSYCSDKLNVRWLVKKVYRLGVPYIIWTLFSCVIYGELNNIVYRLFVRPYYWYLITLLIFSGIYFVHSSVFKSRIWFVLLEFVMLTSLYVIWRDNAILKDAVMFFPFYSMGILIKEYNVIDKLSKKSKTRISMLALIYPLAILFYSYQKYDYILDKIKGYIEYNSVYVDYIIKGILYLYNHLVVPVFGIIYIWIIVSWLENKKTGAINKIYNIFCYAGKYSIEIYILSSFFIHSYFDNTYIDSGLSFILAMVVPGFIGWGLCRYIPIAALMFGEKRDKRNTVER